MLDASRFQPRYLAFLRATGADPETARSVDYMRWIGERWNEWRGLNGISRVQPLSLADHASFDEWLAAQLGGPRTVTR